MGMFGGGLLGRGPSTIDKIEMLFTDVETKGEKQGYARAAKEYGPIYEKIANEYKETKELFVKQKSAYKNQAYELNKRLENLEKERESLQKQMISVRDDIAKKYNIPPEKIIGLMRVGCVPEMLGILDMIYSYKEKKLRQAELRGYTKARELYERKIKKLQDELHRLKEKVSSDKEAMQNLVLQMSDEIVKIQMQIAELRIWR